MSLQTVTTPDTFPESGTNPLDTLAHALSTDMDAVNDLILTHLEADVPVIAEIARYLIVAGGKRIRPLLTLACTRLFDEDTARIYGLATAVEFIHTATLLHDDVVDESTERRGQTSTNLVYGNQSTILVGDFLFSRAFQLMVADGSLDVLRILSDASAIITQGEVMQLQIANNLDTTLDQYKDVIAAKTAALFAASCEIGPVIAQAGPAMQNALRAYGYNLGMAFQIADDVLDYSANREKLGKTIGDDFREGKMTAPLILAIQKADATERAFWQRTIGDRNQTADDLATALALLEKHKALQEGLALCDAYAHAAEQAIDAAPDSPLKPVLKALIGFTIRRDR